MIRRKVKYKREYDPIFISYQSKINNYGNILPIPNFYDIQPEENKSSWYSNFRYNFDNNNNNNNNLEFDISNFNNNKVEVNTVKIRCHPDDYQKNILKFWFLADKEMYNATISFIRKVLPYISIRLYKTAHSKKKFYFYCQKKIKELNEKKKSLVREKNKLQTQIDKKDKLKRKTKIIEKQIDELNIKFYFIECQIKEINIDIGKLNKSISENKKYISIFDELEKKVKLYTNYRNLRTNNLKDIKAKICEKYKNYNIPSHSIDASIKRACISYKSGITNLLDGNIKRFRVKCLNENNNKGIIEMEKCTFIKNKNSIYYDICKNNLGEMIYEYNKKECKILKPSTSSFYFDGNKYWLLYTKNININKNENNNKKEYIGLDSGIRVFQTGFSEDHCIDFGCNVYDKIKGYLFKIDKLNAEQNVEKEIEMCKNRIEEHQKILDLLYLKEKNAKSEKNIKKLNDSIYFNLGRIEKLENLNQKDKQKYEKYLNIIRHSKANYYYNIIKRKIDDLHWKTASELANNYKIVILSQFSMKSVCEQDKVTDMVKRIGTIMRHFDFRSKLVYKCLEKGTKIKVSEEKYTTKTCSICGHYNETIKSEKDINCKGCERIYPRDKFSARGLIIKNLK
jgi:hypothetical protein